MTYRKKLIEVALPLEAINKESAREKSIRHGHPSTLHLWWSRKPLATSRAVLFASLVDDPGTYLEEEAAEKERRRLFALIEDLVKWENTGNEDVLNAARLEIARSVARQKGIDLGGDLSPEDISAFLVQHAPRVMDPFAGGGSIPLEAQRLGLKAYASDLNPVAVLINKALIEIPPRFANLPPVNPETRQQIGGTANWRGAAGLAEDIRYYGRMVRDMAYARIGHLYPKVQLPQAYGGGEANVIAWLWARTVKCPNPACGAQMPLASKFWLSKKKGKEAWVESIEADKGIKFDIKYGVPKYNKLIEYGTCYVNDKGKKVKATFKCITCGQGIAKGDYIDREANNGNMDKMPLAMVLEGKNGRLYQQFSIKDAGKLDMMSKVYFEQHNLNLNIPEQECRGTFASNAQGRMYGFRHFSDYFSIRQLVTLITFGQLIKEIRDIVIKDAFKTNFIGERKCLNNGCSEAIAYADAVATYLAIAVDKMADRGSSICSWDVSRDNIRNTFARQAIPMNWDYAEGNPFSDSTGNWLSCVNWVVEAVANAPITGQEGMAHQADATSVLGEANQSIFSTDPPYYDNIGYADLSDFFYVWLRNNLKDIYPDLFRTMLTPKNEELVATPYRFGGSKDKAKEHFERGLQKTFQQMCQKANPNYPVTVYYAFKQAENDSSSSIIENGGQMVASTGWETMLNGLVASGFLITGTWPMRTELSNRPVASGTNALASSIVLVCRPRPADAPVITRRELLSVLKKQLPNALKNLQKSSIAPVDLAQAAIGPGMAVFSSYSKVLEADGSPMTVRTALALINQVLDEYLTEQEGEYDADTRWALAWFEQYGMKEGLFGDAETLSKAKNTSVNGLVWAGILNAKGGKVGLKTRDEYPGDWDPAADRRPTVWEAVQYLILALEKSGEAAAARLLNKLGPMAEATRDLSYRLFNICERKGWSSEALAYNSLVVAWPRLLELAVQVSSEPKQGQLF